MNKIIVVILAVFFVFSSVSSADEWDDFSNDSGDDSVLVNDSGVIGDNVGDIADSGSNIDELDNVDEREMGEGKYTPDFYIAVGLLAIGVLILIFFVYLFLKKPKNKWEK
jgi:hypothetical protein